MTISGRLIKGLLDLGYAGFPSAVVTRTSSGSTDLSSGKVVLNIVSEVAIQPTIKGVTYCNSDSSVCPSGQTCQSNMICK